MSSGSSGSGSAAHPAVSIPNSQLYMTDAEIDIYNGAIDRNEKAALAREEKHAQTLLGKLSMPEDVAIDGKRLTGLRLTDAYITKAARQTSDDFIYDPDERIKDAAMKRKNSAPFWVRNKNAKKARATALGAGFAPGTPEPPSPRLNVPKARAFFIDGTGV